MWGAAVRIARAMQLVLHTAQLPAALARDRRNRRT